MEFDYPSTWQYNPAYPDYEDPQGRDSGFFLVDAVNGTGMDIDDIVRLAVEHKLRPFGEQPEVETVALPAGDARLIFPEEAAPDPITAELIIKYPTTVEISTSYKFFVLYAHKQFVRDIAPTIRFIE